MTTSNTVTTSPEDLFSGSFKSLNEKMLREKFIAET